MKNMKLFSLGVTILFLTLLALAGCGTDQADYDALLAQKTALESEKQTLQNQYDAANAELTSIKKVYPPRDFNSKTDLENWLAQNTVSEESDIDNAENWIGKVLAIQEDALLDGYIINIDYDYSSTNETYTVYCTTVIDGFIWFWDPETDDIRQDTTLGAIE
jgi:hypothetical protein